MGTEAAGHNGKCRRPIPFGPIRAVVFDLDGTLVDAFEDIAAAANYGLDVLGLARLPYATIRSYVGNGLAKLAERALGPAEAARPGQIERLTSLIAQYYVEHPADYARPYPGVAETLAALRQRGIATAVVSNKRHDLTVLVLERLRLAPLLDAIQGETPALARKPDPAGILTMLERLGAAPSEAFVVGDGQPDAEAARDAGARFVGVSWGLLERKRLLELGAIEVLDRLEDLIPLLSRKLDKNPK